MMQRNRLRWSPTCSRQSAGEPFHVKHRGHQCPSPWRWDAVPARPYRPADGLEWASQSCWSSAWRRRLVAGFNGAQRGRSNGAAHLWCPARITHGTPSDHLTIRMAYGTRRRHLPARPAIKPPVLEVVRSIRHPPRALAAEIFAKLAEPTILMSRHSSRTFESTAPALVSKLDEHNGTLHLLSRPPDERNQHRAAPGRLTR